jgi:signal transduction histidine kinase
MKSKTILIIDDDPAIISVFSAAIKSMGYDVISAANGIEGLSLARKFLPDLILSDVNMPGMDGKNLLHQLREDPNLGTTQIVLMTGQPQATSPRVGMNLGADDFLVKPFGLSELEQCLAARLQRARVHWRVEEKVLQDLRSNLRKNLPHEFFTPLAGMLGLAEVLQGGWKEMEPDDVDELLGEVVRAGWKLQRTLRNYLWVVDMDSLPASPLTQTSTETSQASAQEVREVMELQAQSVGSLHQRDADIHIEAPSSGLPVNRQNLEVILGELLDNACVFSAAGTPISVRISPEGTLSVQDQGRGMTEDQLHQIRVFHQFERDRQGQQGLGLGLVLVQKLVEKCGAEFELVSKFGEGTTASVHFAKPA